MDIKFLKANNGDCILISFLDSQQIKRNILIDGGMPQTYYNSATNEYGELYSIIEKIKKSKDGSEKLDLLILTHIDEDHIGGILTWLSMDVDASNLIGKVWFNSGLTIAKYFEIKENEDLKISLNQVNVTETSVRQGKIFEQFIEQHGIWDKEIIKEDVTFNFEGVTLEVLSPNEVLLNKLLKEHKKPIHKYFTETRSNDWAKNIAEFIDEEKKVNFKQSKDYSVTNGSSISFLLTFQKKSFLFLGDSHPEVILNYLNKKGFNKEEKKLEVEFVKISHHGSCKNTTKELLEVIDTSNYIISTSSEFHSHPDKRTLARIIDVNPKATIYFNYDEVRKEIFSKKDFEDFENFYAKNTSEYIIEW